MRSFSTYVFVLAIGALLFFSSPACAAVIFQDDFEGQTVGNTLTSCTPAVGGGSYIGGYSSSGNILDNTTSPPAGGAGGSAKFVGGTGDISTMMYMSSANQAATTGKTVRFSFDAFVVNSDDASLGIELLATLGTPWYAGSSMDIFLKQNGSLMYYDGVGGYKIGYDYGYHDVTGTFRRDMWVPVEVVVDYATHTFQANVDGVQWSGNSASDADNVGLFAIMRSSTTASNTFFVDNVSASIVPEPSAIALLATGLIGLLCYAWRKRR